MFPAIMSILLVISFRLRKYTTSTIACSDLYSLCVYSPDLLTVPPGFKKGMDFAPKGEF